MECDVVTTRKSHGGDLSAHKATTLSPFGIDLQAKDLVANDV